jgi:hypothetical protein
MIPTPLSRRPVGGVKQGVHFWLFQVRDDRPRGFLERHRADASVPFDPLGGVQTNEPGQRVNGGQTLVACGDRTGALLLQLGQELAQAVGRQVEDRQAIYQPIRRPAASARATARFVPRAYFASPSCQSAGSKRSARMVDVSSTPIGCAEGPPMSWLRLFSITLCSGRGMALTCPAGLCALDSAEA